MSDHIPDQLMNLDPNVPTHVTESGEVERPQLVRRIECGGNPEAADRRSPVRAGRRRYDTPAR